MLIIQQTGRLWTGRVKIKGCVVYYVSFWEIKKTINYFFQTLIWESKKKKIITGLLNQEPFFVVKEIDELINKYWFFSSLKSTVSCFPLLSPPLGIIRMMLCFWILFPNFSLLPISELFLIAELAGFLETLSVVKFKKDNRDRSSHVRSLG